MTKIIAIANQKGGVAKTTTTHNLARGLKGNVLVIDYDAQRNLSKTRFKVNNVDSYNYTIIDLLNQKYDHYRVYQDSISKVDLIVGSVFLNEENYTKFSLKETLENLKKATNYDFILIDCPPKPMDKNINTLNEMAFIAADYIISPLIPDEDSVEGLDDLINHYIRIKENYNPNLELIGFFFNVVEINTKRFIKYHKVLTDKIDDYYLRSFIRKDEAIHEAKAKGRTVIDYAPKSRASLDYKKLVKEINKRIKT